MGPQESVINKMDAGSQGMETREFRIQKFTSFA